MELYSPLSMQVDLSIVRHATDSGRGSPTGQHPATNARGIIGAYALHELAQLSCTSASARQRIAQLTFLLTEREVMSDISICCLSERIPYLGDGVRRRVGMKDEEGFELVGFSYMIFGEGTSRMDGRSL